METDSYLSSLIGNVLDSGNRNTNTGIISDSMLFVCVSAVKNVLKF